MNRMREEKESQRQNNNQRQDQDRFQAKGIYSVVATIALGAGALATKP